MADFPGKVNTQTSSPQFQTDSMSVMNISVGLNFIKSVPGILLLVEIVSCEKRLYNNLMCNFFFLIVQFDIKCLVILHPFNPIFYTFSCLSAICFVHAWLILIMSQQVFKNSNGNSDYPYTPYIHPSFPFKSDL